MSILKVNAMTKTDGSAFSFGKTIQIKQTKVLTTASQSGSSFADTPLVVAITPTSATSKILCTVGLQFSGSSNGNNTQYKLIKVVSGTSYNLAFGQSNTSSNKQGFSGNHTWTNGDGYYSLGSMYLNTLDTATSTAEHTYKVQWASSSGTAYINRTGYSASGTSYAFSGCSTITVMEVSA